MWVLRVYLRSGQTVELIYRGAEACKTAALEVVKPDAAMRDDFGKAFSPDDGTIAAVMTSDYDAELAGAEAIQRCQISLQQRLQRQASAIARPMPAGLVING